MIPSLRYVVPVFLLLGIAPLRAADYPPPADYPMSQVEHLYDDLSKLPADQRAAKILEGAKKEGKLELIQAFGGPLGRGHTKIFRDAYPFVEVNEAFLGTDDATSRLVAEELAGRHLTDVAVSVGIPEINGLIDNKIAARFKTPATDKILPQYRGFMDPDNRFTLSHWSENGMSYNTDMLKPEEAPKSRMDLCNPKYKGNVSFEPVRSRVVAFFQKIMGEEGYIKWLECMSKNQPILQNGYTVRMTLMLAGDHAIQGENFWYSGFALKKKNPKTPFAPILEAELLGNGGAAVINRNTTRPYASALFVDWVLTDPPQQYLAQEYRGPVTLKHPFLPENVKLVTMGMIDTKETERLMNLWTKYLGKGKG
jgi:iron(III) transport system substrate-binding protein